MQGRLHPAGSLWQGWILCMYFPAVPHIYAYAYIHIHTHIYIPETMHRPEAGKKPLTCAIWKFSKPSPYWHNSLCWVLTLSYSLLTCPSTSRNELAMKPSPTQCTDSPGLCEAGCMPSTPPLIRNDTTSHAKSSFSSFCYLAHFYTGHLSKSSFLCFPLQLLLAEPWTMLQKVTHLEVLCQHISLILHEAWTTPTPPRGFLYRIPTARVCCSQTHLTFPWRGCQNLLHLQSNPLPS